MKMVKILWSATFTTDMNFETLFMWKWKAIYLTRTCSWRTQFLKDFNFQCPWNSILLKCWTILLWVCDGRTVNTSTRWPSNMHPGSRCQYVLLSGYLPPVNTWIIDYCHWGKSVIGSIIKPSDGGWKVKPTNAGCTIQNHDKCQYPCDMSNLWKYSFSYFWSKY